jgi:hypothetical protein
MGELRRAPNLHYGQASEEWLSQEKTLDFLGEFACVLDFALPHHQDLPARSSEFRKIGYISLQVPPELWNPIILVGLWEPGIAALSARMLMPETAVYEYDLAASGKNEIGFSWQVLSMKTKAKAKFVDETPYHTLGFHIDAADRAHVFASARFREFVHLKSLNRAEGQKYLEAVYRQS